MSSDQTDDLDRRVRDGRLVAAAVARAQADAVRRHRLLGHPIPVWRDGQLIELLPPDYADVPPDAGDDA